MPFWWWLFGVCVCVCDGVWWDSVRVFNVNAAMREVGVLCRWMIWAWTTKRRVRRKADYDELDLVFVASLLLLKAMGIEFNIAIIVKRARQTQRTSPKRTEESTQRRQEKERERQAGMQAKENTVQRVVASSVSMYFALYLCQHHEHTHTGVGWLL